MIQRVCAVARKACGAIVALVCLTSAPAAADVAALDVPVGERHRWVLLAGTALVAAEAVLIIGLLVQRRERAQARDALAGRLRFEQLVSEVSRTLAALSPVEVDAQLPQTLLRVATELGFDRASLFELADDPARSSVVVADSQPLSEPLALERLPWTVAAVRRDEVVRWPTPSDIPDAASEDRAALAALGTEGFVGIPLKMGGTAIGALLLVTVKQTAQWPATLIQRSALLGGVCAQVIVRQRAERTVRESEEWFQMMADSAPVMIWMAEVDGSRTYCNRQWLQFTGRRLEDELGAGWAESVHPDDREHCLERYRKHFQAREEFLLEYRLRREDGEYRWLLDRGVPRVSHDGVFRGYVGACSDITEMRIAHDTMLETVSLRGAIFGSLYGHVAALDRRGVIVAVNEAWSRFHKNDSWGTMRSGLGTDYVLACQRAAGGDAGAQQAEKALRAVLEGRASRASCEYVAHGAEERWFEMTVEPFKRPEGGVIVTHIDITRRRRAEADARREREELAHVLRVTTLSEMAASLAHEISQPLVAIVSNAQAARLMLAKQTGRDDEVDGALTDIGNDAKRAAHIIRRLRALFRKEWAEQRKPVNVNDIIVEVTALLQAELKPKGVAVQLQLGRALPPVYGDAIQLQQVILNVIINAAEAMAAAATEPASVTVATVQTGEGTMDITIEDGGPGVGDQDLDRIFEPFVTTKKAGLGMGLSISRSIIQAHGGRIWATRNVDRGLTVHIELPSEEREDRP